MSPFKIVEHTLPGQHIREHPHALSGRQEGVVQLAIKQYIPLDQPTPVPDNAVTVIGVHGNGSLKPVIFDENIRSVVNPARFVANRRDLWESRDAAEATLRKSLRKWDPRVVDRYLKFGIRSVPTRLYNKETNPDLPDSAMTLTTTRHQESWSYTIPNLEPESAGLDRLLLADWDPKTERPLSFGRPECWSCMRNLPYLRPSVLWVFGGRSYLSPPEAQDSKVRSTGTGVGGSGGADQGMVKKVVFEDASHTLVFEQIDQSADAAAEWVQSWFQGWLADEKLLAGYQSKRSEPGMFKASEGSLGTAMMPPLSERPKGKL
ncbi:hypothetical protein PENSUB_8930 [Penicillium subrubescens]|uniref:Toxin biosynthesis protein n=1 Tax=Penicillium subrubescens TaxID=1316194 RepID=A0A1Q5TFL1_9EURO|nr:hypothetical protein PENSUB_8930 [Penicillium subrubescens]